jgi:hypothetical protein
VKLSERRELSVTLATFARCPGEEEVSHMLDGRNQTRPKIWLILGAVIAVAVVLLVVLYGGGGGSGTGGTGGY